MPAQNFVGTIPSGTLASVDLLFDGLLPLQWRGIDIPYTRLRLSLRQDLAVQKFVDRDGAHVEGTGRAPLQFNAHIPFLNTISPGSKEGWTKGTLYPGVWRKIFEACADKTTGVLTHPELGAITCKLENFECEWDGNIRAGVNGDITWLETTDASDNPNAFLSNPSPLASLAAFGAAADAQIAQAININAQLQQYQPGVNDFASFSDLSQSIRAVFDTVTILQKSFAGKIDNIIYQCNAIEYSANNARNALQWPVVQSLEALKYAAYTVKSELLSRGRPVAFYVLGKDMTLGQVATSIPAPLTDLMNLNPQLVQAPIVPQGTQIRYYTS